VPSSKSARRRRMTGLSKFEVWWNSSTLVL
jgi:hypothetical protein